MNKVKNFFKLSPLGNIFFLILNISVIIYALLNRSFVDFLKYSLLIDRGILFILSIPVFFLLIFKNFNIIKSFSEKNDFTYFIILICLLGPIYYSLGAVINDIPKFKSFLNLPKNLIIPATVFLILIIGLILFYIRLHFRCVYGSMEAVVGIIMAINKVSQQTLEDFSNSNFYFVILTASLYLVVRGFDNIQQGLTKEPFDPLARKINVILKLIKS